MTAAQRCSAAAPNLRDVQAALRHAQVTTTEIYLPLVVKGLREAMAGRSYRRAGG